ncbi:hypothetical protein M431DRAFT_226785 [Trichoderma harzianum CBS 226.95]|uniref:Uncharacterized protein n=1 Tax=Trichoderma harzianum CBS 226.95 TaxID=983964 RepID=A0A2T4A3X6_TRIHA|nr:hypothetical protein M431DRAFT_226785 [Trichoderma harzianum CBS 226.95]PTB51777.1 hypothetical protein M431DRAFT_226785 [Trichoderma harzianum CBS 226.95]
MLLSSISRPGVVSRAEIGTEAAYVNSYNMPVLLFAHLLHLDRPLPYFLSAQFTVERFIPGPDDCRLAITGKVWLLRPAPGKSLSSSRVSAGVAPYLHPFALLVHPFFSSPPGQETHDVGPEPSISSSSATWCRCGFVACYNDYGQGYLLGTFILVALRPKTLPFRGLHIHTHHPGNT